MAVRIKTLNNDLTNSGEVTTWEKLEFTRSWNSVGTFAIEINDNNPNAKYLTVDKIIIVEDDDMIVKKYGYIDYSEVSETIGVGNRVWTIKGYELKDRIDRVAYPPTGSARDSYSNQYLETVIKSLFTKNVVSPTLTQRKIPNVQMAPDQNRGTQINYSVRYKDMMTEVYTLLQSQSMGLKAYIDTTTVKTIFDVVEGNDRTVTEGQSGGVYLSLSNGSVLESTETRDKLTYKNLSVTAGQGEGADRTIVEVGTNESGYARRELSTDARDVDSDDELTNRGKQKLAETQNSDGKNLKFNPSGPYKIETKFDLGDFLTYGSSVSGLCNVQVIKIKYTYSSGRKEPGIDLILDYDVDDALAKSIQASNINIAVLASWENSSGGGSTTFDGLTDTPSSKTDNAGNVPIVNTAEDALEYKNLGSIINDSDAKTNLVDTDKIGVSDSSDSNKIKKWSWTNIKASILDFLYSSGFCVRETLKSSRTYYTKPGTGAITGSGTLNDPWTGDNVIQYAIDAVAMLDISIYDAIIDLWSAIGMGTVTYTLTSSIIMKPPVGSGRIVIKGNPTNKDSVIIDATAVVNAFVDSSAVGYDLEDFQILGNGGQNGLRSVAASKIRIDGLHFNSVNRIVYVSDYSNVRMLATNNVVKISGTGFGTVIRADTATVTSAAFVCDTSSLSSFTTFVFARAVATITLRCTFTTTAISGTNHDITSNSVLDIGSIDIPGNVAGTPTDGGRVV